MISLNNHQQDAMMQIYIMQHCAQIAEGFDAEYTDKLYDQIENVVRIYQGKGGQLSGM